MRTVSQSESSLMAAVALQPVAVAIDGDSTVSGASQVLSLVAVRFQLYTGGIIGPDCGSKLDHGVLLAPRF